MIEIKEYWTDDSTPSDDAIMNGISIADTEHCIVQIHWAFPYSGNYCLTIREGMTLEECKNQLPKCYPV